MMKKISNLLFSLLAVAIIYACGNKLTFKEQIAQDVYEKIAKGYCTKEEIPKEAEVTNLKVGEITPIGDTGMIDVALEYDVTANGETRHITDAMLYLETKNGGKMLAIFCDYDYRNK